MEIKNFLEILSKKVLIMDGATGTELQNKNYLEGVRTPEELNIKFPERIKDVYQSYINAGANIILANTFGANPLKLKEYGLEKSISEIIKNGISLARECENSQGIIVAGDISSTGSYIEPLGKVSFEKAYNAFYVQAELLSSHGADIIVIETMADIKELKAAILASRAASGLPIVAQMTFTQDGTTVTGTSIESFVAMAESLGANAVGLNCSVGPQELLKIAERLALCTNLPISFKPNAGMPVLINKQTVFPGTIEEFVKYSLEAYKAGINMLGGCCGTTPKFIKALSDELKNASPVKRGAVKKFFLSSRMNAIDVEKLKKPILIGERINPTGKKKLQAELLEGSFAIVKDEARKQVSSGAAILDINMGLSAIDETAMLGRAASEVQEIVDVPLCVDSTSAQALEAAVRNCAGRPIINSVNGEKEKLEAILPIAKKYGAALIALTTDEDGIPKTAAKRLDIAKKILEYADNYGVPRENIIFDYLTLAASAEPQGAGETLAALKKSKDLYPECKTVLGVSNISFGLPARQILNAAFFNMAASAGLDFAIVNPFEDWSKVDPRALGLLEGRDIGAKKYIEAFAHTAGVVKKESVDSLSATEKLYQCVLHGTKDNIKNLTAELKKQNFDTASISKIILEALNEAGEKFNLRQYFLPQVILASDAAREAFEYIKDKKDNASGSGKRVVMATVKGDMHDIGKNIVAAVMESYGFEIIDLGKNIDADEIVNKARQENISLIGLSALMTTTMPQMEEVIKKIRFENLNIKVVVGGAPVTEKFAGEIGADGYAKDPVEAVKVFENLL
ncbi:MAG: homocysteine S-methyltransferase family protein [Elusimicrobia bacterium]|nr:homocysteine S-methyltransferase family protein [Elusimicrobiota bacterium]